MTFNKIFVYLYTKRFFYMGKTKREEVVDYLLSTKLMDKCIDYQFNKAGITEYKEDFTQDMWVWLMTYDEEKLYDAFINRHLNAFLTRVIQNNLFSVTSRFYANYRRWDNLKAGEINELGIDISDGE